jgi:hypothetical protein
MRPSVTLKTTVMAQLLLVCEAAEDSDAVLCVCEKLRLRFGPLVGAVAFRSLLHRALVLTRAETGCLEDTTISEDGVLSGINQGAPFATNGQNADAGALLIGHVLALLETFIGDALTRRLLESIWPIPIAGPNALNNS